MVDICNLTQKKSSNVYFFDVALVLLVEFQQKSGSLLASVQKVATALAALHQGKYGEETANKQEREHCEPVRYPMRRIRANTKSTWDAVDYHILGASPAVAARPH